MTRKDYVAIAQAIKAARPTGQSSPSAVARAWHATGVDNCADFIADVMAADNPRFDRARFLKACGVQS